MKGDRTVTSKSDLESVEIHLSLALAKLSKADREGLASPDWQVRERHAKKVAIMLTKMLDAFEIERKGMVLGNSHQGHAPSY